MNIPRCWGGVHPICLDMEIEMCDLDLVTTYCTCGSPDPLEHLETCGMALPIEVLREVEMICAGEVPNATGRMRNRMVITEAGSGSPPQSPLSHRPWCECVSCAERYGPI